MATDGADKVMLAGDVKGDIGRTGGDFGYGTGSIARIEGRLCNFGHIVISSGKIKYKNIANGEVLPGSPGGVSNGTAGRDGPTQGATHYMSRPCGGHLQQRRC